MRDSGTHNAYMPQLDGLRAFAIFGVLVQHFHLSGFLNSAIDLGRLGVILFFVLSGFLITRILLDERDNGETIGASPFYLIRKFYIRRVLRIFPIYYLTILVCAAFDYGPVKDHLIWHLIYFSNFSSAFIDKADYSFSAHLWSLCVEEQFYLAWPFLIVFIKKKHLQSVIITMIALGVIYKVSGAFLQFNGVQTTRPLFGCTDSLGIGALLAYYWNEGEKSQKKLMLLKKASIWFGLPLLILTQVAYALSTRGFHPLFTDAIHLALQDFSAAMFFAYIVDKASRNSPGILGGLLALPPVRYIGKISYGIYIYHFFLKGIFPQVVYSMGITYLNNWQWFVVLSTITIIIASVSWFLIEKPINNLKNYVPYTRVKAYRHGAKNTNNRLGFALLRIAGGLSIVVTAVIASVSLFPYGLSGTANKFITDIKHYDKQLVLAALIKDPDVFGTQGHIPSESFNGVIDAIKNSQSISWTKRSFYRLLGKYPLATLDGEMITQAGSQIPIWILFTKVNLEWKISAIQLGLTNKAINKATFIPGRAQQIALLKNTFSEYAASISGHDFNRFFDYHSAFFRASDKEYIYRDYKELIGKRINFKLLLNLEPTITRVSIDENYRFLILEGYFQIGNARLVFIQKYFYEGSRWAFLGMKLRYVIT